MWIADNFKWKQNHATNLLTRLKNYGLIQSEVISNENGLYNVWFLEEAKGEETMENGNEDPGTGFWGILELMGHVKIAGYITEEEKFGSKMGRIDIPGENGEVNTQFFGGGSVYRITPVTEEVAKAVATRINVRPIFLYRLPERDPTFLQTHEIDEGSSQF